MLYSFAFAAQYTESDFKKLTANGAVTVNVSKSAKRDLNYFGSKCAKSALASLISKSFEVAENDGVDYPEIIDVKSANAVRPNEFVNLLHIVSSDLVFSIRIFWSVNSCYADEASISKVRR